MKKRVTVLLSVGLLLGLMGASASAQDGTHGVINGHEWVDLGLSVKWATCNVGAKTPEAYGNYYAWGEIKPKKQYRTDWGSYRFLKRIDDDSAVVLSKYTNDDGKKRLDDADDAARANWGSTWRMPTKSEWDELIYYCNWKWTKKDGVSGRLITGRNGNSIFLPAAGYRIDAETHYAVSRCNYWSSSLYFGTQAYGADVSEGRLVYDSFWRYLGLPVRPVTN